MIESFLTFYISSSNQPPPLFQDDLVRDRTILPEVGDREGHETVMVAI